MTKTRPETLKERADAANLFELGTWHGRRQALSTMAGKCSAAEVECLREIRDGKLYRAQGLGWAGYCRQYAGFSKGYADRLIQDLQELGPGYFQLSQLVRISAGSYRAIAGAVSEAGIEFAGQTIAIAPENSGKIAEAVAALKKEARRRSGLPGKQAPGVADAARRIEACVAQIQVLRVSNLSQADRGRLKEVVALSVQKLMRISLAME